MTAEQTMKTVRMLIDERRDFFWNDDLIINAINHAQMQLIHKAIQAGDERLLRPLYRVSDNVFNSGDYVFLNGAYARVLQPMGVRLTMVFIDSKNITRTASFMAEYLSTERFFIRDKTKARFPVGYYYTTITEKFQQQLTSEQQTRTKLFFTSETILNTIYVDAYILNYFARLLYIEIPRPFNYSAALGYPQSLIVDLSIPQEYHFEVCALAARYLDVLDVGEDERGAPFQLGQYIDIDKIGDPNAVLQAPNA